MDGWDFKTYMLGMLFYRFISENLAGYLNETLAKVFKAIEGSAPGTDSEDDLKGLIDSDRLLTFQEAA